MAIAILELLNLRGRQLSNTIVSRMTECNVVSSTVIGLVGFGEPWSKFDVMMTQFDS